MQWIRAFILTLLLAGCGQQAPAPVVFNHQPVERETAAANQPANAAVQTTQPIAVVSVAPPPMQGDIEVQRGDTLYALSRRHQVPVRALIEANDLQPPYSLQPGQRLRLPGQRFHMVQRGETLYAISRAYDIDMYSLAQANDLPPPYLLNTGQPLRIPSSSNVLVAAAPSPQVSTMGSGAPASVSSSAGVSPTSSAGGVTMEALPPPSATSTPSQPPQPAPQQTTVAPLPTPRAIPPQPASQPPAAETAPPQQVAVVPPSPPPSPPVMSAPGPIPAPAPVPAPAAVPTPPAQPAPRPEAEAEPPPRSGRSFAWPVRGRILSTFGTKPDGTHNDGLNIAARAGSPVIAAENGVVVYSGSELRGFGNLLLLRHADGWITAYAHLDRVLVKKGQRVTRGQAIATVGSSGGVDQPQLHFEIRRGTQAVDPAKFLSVAMMNDQTPFFSAWLFHPASHPGARPGPG